MSVGHVALGSLPSAHDPERRKKHQRKHRRHRHLSMFTGRCQCVSAEMQLVMSRIHHASLPAVATTRCFGASRLQSYRNGRGHPEKGHGACRPHRPRHLTMRRAHPRESDMLAVLACYCPILWSRHLLTSGCPGSSSRLLTTNRASAALPSQSARPGTRAWEFSNKFDIHFTQELSHSSQRQLHGTQRTRWRHTLNPADV